MNTRTNVVLDQELVREAKSLTGIKTTRGVIDEALRTLVMLHRQEQVRALRGQLQWQGDLGALRQARFSHWDEREHETTG